MGRCTGLGRLRRCVLYNLRMKYQNSYQHRDKDRAGYFRCCDSGCNHNDCAVQAEARHMTGHGHTDPDLPEDAIQRSPLSLGSLNSLLRSG